MKTILTTLIAICTLLLISGYSKNDSKNANAGFKPMMDVYAYAFNSGNVDTLNSICNSTFTRFNGLTRVDRGLDSVKIFIKGLKTAFPDFTFSIDQEVFADEHATLLWTLTGTNTGPGRFPPTGKSFKVSGLSLFTFKDGKLESERFERDALYLMQQLGFTLTPPGK
jgi:predicted ester cyclase